MAAHATRVVYICSAGHSGSTLLDLILGAHSRIASLGEIDQLPKNVALDTECACGERVRECAVWRETLRRMSARRGVDLMQQPYRLQLGYPLAQAVVDPRQQTPAYRLRRKFVLGLYYLRLRFGLKPLDACLGEWDRAIASSFELFDTAAAVQGADIVVDSSKSYLRALALYRAAPERVRVVLLTRDGRGVLWSRVRRGVPVRRAVRRWMNQYRRSLPLLERHVAPTHLHRLRYEALANDPADTVAALCRFMDVVFEPAMLDFRAHEHHITNGNNMRLDASSEIRADDAWRRRLPADALTRFQRMAGRLNRDLGYEP